ncbi:MAG: uroporphyrinogen-III C-methyltransferase [Gammaproteobacteria bacterium]|nr:uroporphyrinogen-III C-methyltransferase [Gammaproteobacteria bacterium]
MSPTETTTKQPVTDSSATDKTAKPADKKASKASRSNSNSKSFSGFLLLLILLLGLSAAGYYFWLQLQARLDQLSVSNTIQSANISELNQQLTDASALLQQQQTSLQASAELLTETQSQLKALTETQQTLINTSQNSYDISHRSQTQWVLAEVAYLLALANQRLQISEDIKTSIIALKSANQRLQELSDPSLLKVRKKISEEIYQLTLLKQPDINAIAFSLDNMMQAIQQLPFKSLHQQLLEQPSNDEIIELVSVADESLFATFWSRIKSLVTIKKHNRVLQSPVNALDQQQILSRLRTALESSRIAAINKNTALFQLDSNKALDSLSQHYDKSDNRVAALISELSALSQLTLMAELPDITGSSVLLQNVIALKDANSQLGQQPAKNNRGKSQQ